MSKANPNIIELINCLASACASAQPAQRNFMQNTLALDSRCFAGDKLGMGHALLGCVSIRMFGVFGAGVGFPVSLRHLEKACGRWGFPAALCFSPFERSAGGQTHSFI